MSWRIASHKPSTPAVKVAPDALGFSSVCGSAPGSDAGVVDVVGAGALVDVGALVGVARVVVAVGSVSCAAATATVGASDGPEPRATSAVPTSAATSMTPMVVARCAR